MRFATMSTTKCLRMLAQMGIERSIGCVFKGTVFLGAPHSHPNVLNWIEGHAAVCILSHCSIGDFDLGDIFRTINAVESRFLV